MARKSSRDKRLVDKSQAGTRGTGNGLTGRHGGVPAPTSGDRGNSTNRAEGSSAVRRSGQTQEHSASNSATGKSRTKGHVQGNTTGSHAEDSSTGQTQPATQEHSASPESQTRDSDQESTNASEIDSDEQQRESCSNLSDHDEPLDPGNRKRKLGQAITEILVSSLKKIKTSPNSDVLELHRAARSIPRFVGPFINIRTTFITGARLAFALSTDSEAFTDLAPKDQVILNIYEQMLAVVPGLEEQVNWTQKNNPSGLLELATFLDKSGNKGRSDDCATLREDAIGYIRPVKDVSGVEDIPEVDRKAKKDTRGFHHHSTARLLCPRDMLGEFDKDREKFCHDVVNGKRAIFHGDWPAFLYPEEGYNDKVIDKGLLRGPFLVSCYRHIFTGARTAMKTTPGKAPGKKCLADLYDMTEVTPATIAYTAVLCRHVLNAKESWATHDGPFKSEIFFDYILDLFDGDETWATETLNWWNDQVFGDDPRAEDTVPPDYQSAVERLAAQRAARQKEITPGLSPNAPASASNANAAESQSLPEDASLETPMNNQE